MENDYDDRRTKTSHSEWKMNIGKQDGLVTGSAAGTARGQPRHWSQSGFVNDFCMKHYQSGELRGGLL